MDLYIDEAHTALDIFRFAAFLSKILGEVNMINTLSKIGWEGGGST